MKQQATAERRREMRDRLACLGRAILGRCHRRQFSRLMLTFALVSWFSSCSSQQASKVETSPAILSPDTKTAAAPEPNQTQPTVTQSGPASAEVLKVSATGDPGAYTFSVTILSPDTGCDQYANWWEVLSLDGQLRYRRILLHSHVNEQPFTRSGGPAPIQPNEAVIVRAHMHPGGYGPSAQQGTVAAGFTPVTLPADFAATVAEQSPQPSGCNF